MDPKVEGLSTADLNTSPSSTAIARIDDDTIAVTYDNGMPAVGLNTVAIYDIDVTVPEPFIQSFVTTFETSGSSGQVHSHSLMAVDSTKLLVAYSYGSNPVKGYLRVINIDVNPPTFDNAISFADKQGRYPSMIMLDDDTIVIASRGGSAVGQIRAFDVSSGDNTFTLFDSLTHDTGRVAYNSLVKVDDNTVALAYSEIGESARTDDGTGHLKTFSIAVNGTIKQTDDKTYYNAAADAAGEERVHLNSLVLLDSDTLALAYRGADADGFIRLYDIDHTTGELTATARPYEHDMADGAFNSLVRVDDGTLALVYGGDLPSPILDDTDTAYNIKTFTAIGSDTTPPVIESAVAINANTIVLAASQTLKGDANNANFGVSENSIIGDPEIFGSIIVITVSTAIASVDTPTVSYAGSTITDVAGNELDHFSRSVTTDTQNNVPSTVDLTAASVDNGGTTNSRTISYTAVFSAIVTGFEETEVVITGAALGAVVPSTFNGTNNPTYTFDVMATADGELAVSIPAGAVGRIPSHLTNVASGEHTITIDTTGPSVTVSSDVDDGASINQSEISYTVTFDADVTGFDASDIEITGTANGGIFDEPSLTPMGGSVYMFDVAITSDGTVSVHVAENAAHDLTGNGNAASNTHTVTVNTQPLVILSAVWRDPDESDSILSNDDELIITFNQDTDMAGIPTLSRSELDAVFDFGGTLGADYTGKWSDARTLVITIVDSTDADVMIGDTISPFRGTAFIRSLDTAGGTAFSNPNSVGTNSTGHVFVGDTSRRNVQIFHPDGSYAGVPDTTGGAAFSRPEGIATNSTGYTFIADNGPNLVQIFDPSGVYAGALDIADGLMFREPAGIAIGKDDMIYVSDIDENRDERDRRIVQIFNQDGTYAGVLATTVTTEFNVPISVATNSSGHVFVADSGNDNIRIFNPTGEENTSNIDTTGPTGSTLRAVATNSTDHLFVVYNNSNNNNNNGADTVQVYTASGVYAGEQSFGDDVGLETISGIAVGSDDKIIISERENDAVHIFGHQVLYSDTELEQFQSPISTSGNFGTLTTSVFISSDVGNGAIIKDTPVRFDVEFNEDVTGFDESDILLSGMTGATVSDLFGNGAMYTFNVNPDNDGTVTVSIRANAADDGNVVSNVYTFTVIGNAPNVARVFATNSTYTTGDTVDITITFSESVTVDGFPQLLLEIGTDDDDGAAAVYTGGSPGTDIIFQYTVAAGHNSDDLNYASIGSLISNGGSITANDVAASLVLPAVDSDESLGGSSDVVVDARAPDIVSTDVDNDGFTNSRTISYTVIFGNAVTGFAVSDITVSGTAGATASALSETSPSRYTFDVIAGQDGTVSVSIDAGMVTFVTPVGQNTVSNTVSNTYTATIDTVQPEYRSSVTTDFTTITITANEQLVAGILTTDGFGISGTNWVSGVKVSGSTVILTVGTPIIPRNPPTVSYGGSTITDRAGNALVEFEFQRVTDTLPPIVTRVSAEEDGVYTAGNTINIRVTFNEAVTVTGTPRLLLETGDVDAVAVYDSGSGGTILLFRYTVTAEHDSDDLNYVNTGSLTLDGGAAAILDADDRAPVHRVLPGVNSGNSLAGSSNVRVDNTGPTVVSATAIDTNVGSNYVVEIAFNEPVIGTPIIMNPEFSIPSNLIGGYSIVDGNVRLPVSIPIAGNTNTVTYYGSSITDEVGNQAERFTDRTIINNVDDTVGPTPEIITLTADNGLTAGNGGGTTSNTIFYTVRFSDAVTGFDSVSDLDISGTATRSSVSAPTRDGAINHTFTVTTTSDGTVTVFIPAGKLEDLSENPNTKSNTHTITVDTEVPEFSSAQVVSPTQIEITISERVSGTAETTEFAVPGYKVSGVAVSGDTITLTVDPPITFNDDALTVTFSGNNVTDIAGQVLAFSTPPRTVVNELEDAPLTVTITGDTPNGGTGTRDTVSYTATFNKVVTDFDETDITVSGTASGTASDDTLEVSNFVAESGGTRYTFDVVATSGGTVIVSIPGGVATDAANNLNEPSDPYTVTRDILIPLAVFTDTIGSPGQGDGQFNEPRGITTTSTHILVVDGHNHRVLVFDLEGNYLRSFGSEGKGDGKFDQPLGITATSTQIMVTDSNNHRVQIFDLDGNYVSRFGSFGTDPGLFGIPLGITTTPTRILVTETFNHRVQIFDSDGDYVSQFGSEGSGIGQFSSPRGITTTSTNILVVDGFNHRVQVFDLDGNYLRSFGSNGSGPGQFNSPSGITTTPTHILVTEATGDRIQIFDLDGNYVGLLASGGTGDGQFDQPRGITANSTHILVADGDNHRVQVFDFTPTVVITTITPHGGTHTSDTVPYTVTFSEEVFGFVVDDIVISGTASNDMPTISNFAGSGATYTFDVETTRDGTVTVSIPKFAAVDVAGSSSMASNTHTVTVAMDRFGISSAVWQDPDQLDSILSDGDELTITFDRDTDMAGYQTLTKLELDSVFDFGGSLGANYTGAWPNAQTLVITVIDSTGADVEIGDAISPFRGNTLIRSLDTTGGTAFDNPVNIATNSTGYVFVGDSLSGHVQIFDPDGVYAGALDTSALVDSTTLTPEQEEAQIAFLRPAGIATNSTGYIFVAYNGDNLVQIFDPDGVHAGYLDTTGGLTFQDPAGVAVGPDDRIYVSDTAKNSENRLDRRIVQIFNPDGTYAGMLAPGVSTEFDTPVDVTTNSAGARPCGRRRQ